MKNKIRNFSVLLIISLLLVIKTAYGVEELPDNAARISSVQVVQTKTGTGPWDENNEPGNDSSENNNIVRSFDQVTWTIENTMVLNNSTTNSYTGGKIYFEAILPDVFNSQTVKWEIDSMGWIENAKVSENGLILSGYYQMNNTGITVPGKQTLVFIAKILGAANGIEFTPTIRTWINGNSQDDYIVTKPEKITVSAVPRYNVVLVQNSQLSNKVTVDYGSGNTTGRMYGYGIGLQLYNKDVSKGIKGIEYPKGDITLDLDLKLERSKFSGSSTLEDITLQCTPILWNYRDNITSDYGNIEGRIMKWGNNYHRFYPNFPYGTATKLGTDSVYNSGNIKMIQNGSKIKVTISNYAFDGTFPIYYYTYSGANHTVANYTSNIGFFSSNYFQIFVPDNTVSTMSDRNYYLTLSNSNFSATSISGKTVNSQMLTSDDVSRIQHVVYRKGNYSHFMYLQNMITNAVLSTSHHLGDGYAYLGQDIEIASKFAMSITNDYDVYTSEKFIKFDGDAIEPIKYSNGTKYRLGAFAGTARYNTYYVTKPDGKNWVSQQEMNNADIENMVIYDNIEDIPEGHICIGAFFESIDGYVAVSTGDNNVLFFPVRIKKTAIIGRTYGFTHSTKMWVDEIDRSIYNIKNKGVTYPTPTADFKHHNYIKTEYDENGQIISGTHSGGWAYGQSVLIVGAIQGISLDNIDNNGNKKVNYDLGKNENIVKYTINPTLTNPDKSKLPNIAGVTVTITDTLPKKLTYVPGSSNYGEPEIIQNDNNTTLVWTIYNCTVGEKIDPIVFDASIYDETLNGTQYENKVVISADNDLIGNTVVSKRTATSTIQITNLSSHRLYKVDNTPVIEKNGDIHYTISYKNNTDETIPDFQLLDILPYNGDSRGTDFTGTYTLDRVVVSKEDANGSRALGDMQVLYTNDESARSATSKDENLGRGWTEITSENIKQNATAIVVKGEVEAQGKVTVDIYLKTSDNKGLDKYVNNATAQVYKATEEITTSNVISQVIARKIEGIAWEDRNANGLKDEGEKVISNVELMLTDSLGNQVIDVNGNKVENVMTDESGYYKFENLPKGNYYVKVMPIDKTYKLTEKEVGTNSEINSKFNIEEKETDEITKLNSENLPEIIASNINVGFTRTATSIIVKHITEEGEKLEEDNIIDGKVGDEYTTTQNEYENYEVKIIPENAKGQMRSEQIEVVYVYSLVKGKITITKVDDIDNNKVLSDATFKVEKLTEENTIDVTFIPIEKTTGANGVVEFTEILVGKYRITETKAPEDYELAKNTIDVEITKEQRDLNIQATDRLKLILPETGGRGILIFSVIGIMLIIVATILTIFKRKNK